MTSVEIRDAIEAPVAAIVEAVTTTIEETPPEIIADIMDQGLRWPEAGALLTASTQNRRRDQDAGQDCRRSPDRVVRGTGRCLEDLDTLRKVFVSPYDGTVPK